MNLRDTHGMQTEVQQQLVHGQTDPGTRFIRRLGFFLSSVTVIYIKY